MPKKILHYVLEKVTYKDTTLCVRTGYLQR